MRFIARVTAERKIRRRVPDPDFLLDLRERSRLSQDQLADRFGCTQRYISGVERGLWACSKKYLEHYARLEGELLTQDCLGGVA